MLTENHLRLLAFLEQRWMETGEFPSFREITQEVGLVEQTVKNYLKDEDFTKALNDRGISYGAAMGLTAEQLLVINAVLNTADKRSFRKKLQDAGVSPKKYQGWMRDKRVIRYMEARTESGLHEAIPTAHMALVENVESGDLGSIKLLYEMTGRFKSGQNEVNVPLLVQQILSIIERNVTDPETLRGISQEFRVLMAGAQAVTQGNSSPVPSVIAGVLERRDTPVANRWEMMS